MSTLKPILYITLLFSILLILNSTSIAAQNLLSTKEEIYEETDSLSLQETESYILERLDYLDLFRLFFAKDNFLPENIEEDNIVETDSMYGIIDKYGKMVIKPQYDQLYAISPHYYYNYTHNEEEESERVLLLLNTSAKQLDTLHYSSFKIIDQKLELLEVENDDYTAIINARGKEIKAIYTQIGRSYSFTDEELAKDLKDFELFNTYSQAYYEKTLRKKLPQSIKVQLEDLYKRKGESDFWEEELVWSTDEVGCSWYCGGMHFQTASSCLPDAGKNNYLADNVFDGNVRTAWIEGADKYGIGESINIHFPVTGPQATVCYLVNGYNKDEQTWKNNSRVQSLNLFLDDELIALVYLQDSRDEQYFILPDTIPNHKDPTLYKTMLFNDDSIKVSTLKFEIREVYEGDKYDDTAISEIWFDGIGVHCLAEGTLIDVPDNKVERIEYLNIGELILTYNPATKKHTYKKIKTIHQTDHEVVYTLTFSNAKTLTITEDHPLLSLSGWVSLNPFKTKGYPTYAHQEVGELKIGSEILSYDGSILSVVDIVIEKQRQPMYTLELANSQVAFIANGILVGQE